MARALMLVAVMSMVFGGSVAVNAGAHPVPISGTFFKGPLIGGVDRLARQNLPLVRNEAAIGRPDVGVLTGQEGFTSDGEPPQFALHLFCTDYRQLTESITEALTDGHAAWGTDV